jgi:hypothetical protein
MVEKDEPIRNALGSYLRPVLAVMKGDNSLESDIISSSLDADKLDYLRRDSYHIGVSYGNFDIQRVLLTMCKISENRREYLGILEKGMDALESYRIGRHAMHTQVYEHHARLVADDMFVRAFKSAVEERILDQESLGSKNQDRFLRAYAELDDQSVEHKIIASKRKCRAVRLITAIRERRLLKRAFVVTLDTHGVPNAIKRKDLAELTREKVEELEAEIAAKSKTDPEGVILHLQSIKMKLYERHGQSGIGGESPILVMCRDGVPRHMDEMSRISADLDPIRRIFVFSEPTRIGEVKKASTSVFGVSSMV